MLRILSNGHKQDSSRGFVRAGRCGPGACIAVAVLKERTIRMNEAKRRTLPGAPSCRSVDNERKDRRGQRDLMAEGRKKRGGWKMLSPRCETGEGSK